MKLFSKACREALTIPEQQVSQSTIAHYIIMMSFTHQALSGQFKADPKLVYQVGLTPQKVGRATGVEGGW